MAANRMDRSSSPSAASIRRTAKSPLAMPEIRSRRPAPLADDAAAFAFGAATPDAFLLPHPQCVFEAGGLHRAAVAHRFRLVGVLVGQRVEDLRIEPLAGSTG